MLSHKKIDSLLLALAIPPSIAILLRGFYLRSKWLTLLVVAASTFMTHHFVYLQLPGLMCSVSNSDLLSSLALSLFSSWVMHILLFYSFILVAVSRLLSLLIRT